jgi:PAS domain S-box-containing protein
MLVGDKVVGVISLQNLRQEGLFTEADVRLLSTIAGCVGVGLENARLLEAVQQELTERRRAEALIAGQQHILELIAQGQEIYQTLEAVARFVEERAPQALCSILIMDADGEHLRRGAAPNLPHSFIEVVDGLRIGPAAGSCGTAAYQRQQIISTHIDTDPVWADYREWIITNFDLHACWSTPILAANQRVLGTVALYHRESKAPTDRDLELMDAATHLAGIALLRHEAQQANELLLHETQQRAEELAALNRVTASATTLDLQSTLQATARELVHIFDARNCGVALLNPERTHLVVMADYSARPDDPSAVGVAIPLENNRSSQQVIETGRSLIITEPQTNPLTAPIHDLMRERRTTGLLIVPLRVRGGAAGTFTVIGTIGIDTNQPDREFTLAEAALTETIASQLSNAIENSRLFAETQRRAEQLAAAAEVARVSNAVLEPDTLITQTVDLIRERFDLYYAAIFLVDEVGQWAKLRYATGEAGRKLMELGHKLEIGGSSMIGQAISRRAARIALDVNLPSTDTSPIGVARFANPYLPDTRSEMALPLVVGGSAIGALSVQSTESNAFSQADITVLQTMADQIATALQNARLFTAAQQEIAERIQAQKALDYERYLLHTLLENVPDKIYFKDQNSRFIRASQAVAHQFGLQANDLIGRWDFDFFSAEHAEQAYKDEQELLRTGHSLLGKLERETWPNRPDTWALTSKLVMRDPDGKVIGSFGISRDVTELKLAQDAAQRRAQLLAAAADIGRAATASLDLDTLLRTSVNLIRDRFGFYHASVFIIDPKTAMAVVRESTGEAGKALKARQHQLAVGSKSLVGQATVSREPVVVQDVTQDLTHFKNPLLPDTRAEAVLPLISADRVIGALDVQSTLPNAFATEDMAILATIADQLAVAIQNANLFDRTARQARRERLVGEITNKIRAANSVEAMLQTAVTELRQALGVTHGLARLGDTEPGNGQKPPNGNGSASA